MGQLDEGVYVDGKINGYGRLIYKDGGYHEGYFMNSIEHGLGKHVREGEWKKGRLAPKAPQENPEMN